MGCYQNGKEIDMPWYNGKQYNAYYNGQLIWGSNWELYGKFGYECRCSAMSGDVLLLPTFNNIYIAVYNFTAGTAFMIGDGRSHSIPRTSCILSGTKLYSISADTTTEIEVITFNSNFTNITNITYIPIEDFTGQIAEEAVINGYIYAAGRQSTSSLLNCLCIEVNTANNAVNYKVIEEQGTNYYSQVAATNYNSISNKIFTVPWNGGSTIHTYTFNVNPNFSANSRGSVLSLNSYYLSAVYNKYIYYYYNPNNIRIYDTVLNTNSYYTISPGTTSQASSLFSDKVNAKLYVSYLDRHIRLDINTETGALSNIKIYAVDAEYIAYSYTQQIYNNRLYRISNTSIIYTNLSNFNN
jgi:hypothetical protein